MEGGGGEGRGGERRGERGREGREGEEGEWERRGGEGSQHLGGRVPARYIYISMAHTHYVSSDLGLQLSGPHNVVHDLRQVLPSGWSQFLSRSHLGGVTVSV